MLKLAQTDQQTDQQTGQKQYVPHYYRGDSGCEGVDMGDGLGKKKCDRQTHRQTSPPVKPYEYPSDSDITLDYDDDVRDPDGKNPHYLEKPCGIGTERKMVGRGGQPQAGKYASIGGFADMWHLSTNGKWPEAWDSHFNMNRTLAMAGLTEIRLAAAANLTPGDKSYQVKMIGRSSSILRSSIISFSGRSYPLEFIHVAKSEAKRQAVCCIPNDKILLETDSPYLPSRGQYSCPCHLGGVAAGINILTKFHKDWMKTATFIVYTSDLIYILTKFHKDWMKTVTSTVYTNKLLTDTRTHAHTNTRTYGHRTSHNTHENNNVDHVEERIMKLSLAAIVDPSRKNGWTSPPSTHRFHRRLSSGFLIHNKPPFYYFGSP
ncbi:hypothetical protein DPMN_087034 [Dreissena polymorpha]|uniref:Uncharacterized protein n=1 Tax=Dreissena polymorpha TaxID=45954 RepID=A0A9D4QW03_DREPO|nr:hypothetical protein DPMN_087034 [Dreissena polymorpha]